MPYQSIAINTIKLIPINIPKKVTNSFHFKISWLKSLKSFSQIICYFSVTGKSYVFCDRELWLECYFILVREFFFINTQARSKTYLVWYKFFNRWLSFFHNQIIEQATQISKNYRKTGNPSDFLTCFIL